MRHDLKRLAVGALLLAAGSAAAAGPFPAAGLSSDGAAIVQVQAKKDEGVTETVTRKVRRAWRSVAGYKFDVACPTRRTTCRETGKSRAEARAKCVAKNSFCFVSDAK
jgi:hypothetical protein